MATPPNSSNNSILYGALYEDEEYRPWNDMQTNDHDRRNANRRRLVDGRLFLGATPTWCDLRCGGMSNSCSQNTTHFEAISSNAQSWGASREPDIKFQWEGRGRELELHGCKAMATIHDLAVPSRDVAHNKEKTEEYPKWSTQENMRTTKMNSFPSCSSSSSSLHSVPSERQANQEPSKNTTEQRTRPGNTDSTWNLTLYSNAQNPSSSDYPKRKPCSLDHFYTGIPEERRLHEAGRNLWKFESNDANRRHIEQQSQGAVAIATSDASQEKSDGQRSEKSNESDELKSLDQCSYEADDETAESDGDSKTKEKVGGGESESSVSSGERQTKKRKRQYTQKDGGKKRKEKKESP